MSVTCILMELFRNVCNRIIVVGLFFRVAVLLETGWGRGQVCQASDQANLGFTFGTEL